jgi:hypothetical protein
MARKLRLQYPGAIAPTHVACLLHRKTEVNKTVRILIALKEWGFFSKGFGG